MKKLRVGIVGFGFIGPHHLDAIRRLGFAEVTGIATVSEQDARRQAERYHISNHYASWRQLVADPAIDVVDVATPTNLHAPVALAAIAAGKHVIVDKPMALNTREAKKMHDAARRAGVVNAVTFSIRYNVMLQQARAMIARGAVGDIRVATGHYWQEWLTKETDFNWRLDPKQGGALGMISDAGAHWYDMVQHVTGRRIVRVLADFSRFIPVRQRPVGGGKTVDYRVRVPDFGIILCELDNGARGLFSTGAISAGHKNDLTLEVCGSRASVRWQQERPDELWVGRRDEPNQTWIKDPPLLDPSVRSLAALPGGHYEAWPDAFRNLMRNILGFIAEGRDPREADGATFPTFATGLGIARIVDAIAASAKAGGKWKPVARS
ncbi:MAG: Gfo/Idh/MocA family oxidoreductase [Opitutaceae bacterium]|nr:Gfo/Idh/MocA family oxidoreductase [Opitutaceae bacterium]